MEITFELIEEREKTELIISKHAYARMKERNGWSKKTATRMIQKVYQNGLRPDQIKGYLKGWVNNKAGYSKEGEEFVLFGEKLYIFSGNTMLTVLPVPTRGYLLREI